MSTRAPKRWAGIASGVAAALAGCAGLYLVCAYAYGVFDVLDEPDQSWIFWGLAVLFVGFAMLSVAGVLGVASWALLRTPLDDEADSGLL